MTVRQYENQIAEYGLQEMRSYGRSCRIVAKFSLISTISFLLIMQAVTFFVAVNAGFTRQISLIFAVMPVLGPLRCGFLLLYSGVGSFLILLTLFIPFGLLLFLSVWFHNRYQKVMRVIENTLKRNTVAADAQTVRQQMMTPVQPAAPCSEFFPVENREEQVEPNVMAILVRKNQPSEEDIQEAAVDTAAFNGVDEQDGIGIARLNTQTGHPQWQTENQEPPYQAAIKPSEPDLAAERQSLPDLKAEEEEYSQTMRDVLFLLNKNK